MPSDGPADIQVPHSLLETAPTRSPQAVAEWQESMGALYDVRARRRDDEAFAFRAEAFHLGEIVLTSYRCSGQTFDRSPARIARDGVDHVTLQFCLAGKHGPRDGPEENIAGPGDLLVADLAQRQATATTAFDSLNLTIPRRLLSPRLRSPDAHNLRRIPSTAPLSRLLRNHLAGLLDSAPAMSHEEAQVVVEPTVALAAAILNADAPQEDAPALDPVLLARIRRHIADRAPRTDLTAEEVAARFGVSRRKLYYLMAGDGGFAAYLRDQRLRLANAMLRDPAQRGRPISEIAEQCGFSWRTNFARTYRARFGMTPNETRALAAQSRAIIHDEMDGRHMWEWIRALR